MVGWSGNPTAGDWAEITDGTSRGFTFHEMLDNLNLTHMNGRVYDQIAGRFLSADPFVPSPQFTQSFNRYSYTFNNPLRYTDPSGFLPSPDDQPSCRPVCINIDIGFSYSTWSRRWHGILIPVPRIPLRGGPTRVPVRDLECDMAPCGGAKHSTGDALPAAADPRSVVFAIQPRVTTDPEAEKLIQRRYGNSADRILTAYEGALARAVIRVRARLAVHAATPELLAKYDKLINGLTFVVKPWKPGVSPEVYRPSDHSVRIDMETIGAPVIQAESISIDPDNNVDLQKLIAHGIRHATPHNIALARRRSVPERVDDFLRGEGYDSPEEQDARDFVSTLFRGGVIPDY